MFLQLLGNPALRLSDGRAVELRQRAYAIAAMLYLEFRDRTRRTNIAERIWESSKSEQAMTNLRQTLLHTRKQEATYGFQLFVANTNTIELGPDIIIDLKEIGTIRTAEDPAQLERLVALYKGDLLEGASDTGPEFTQWLHMTRVFVEDQYVRQGTEAALRFGLSGLGALNRMSERLPLSEEIVRAQIMLHQRAGNQAAARSIYNALANRLNRELGSEPSAETSTLLLGPTTTSAPTRPSAQIHALPISPARTEAATRARQAFVPRVVLLPPLQEHKTSTLPRYVAPALIEDVTIRLTRLKSVSVIAPYTAWQLDPFSALDEVRAHQIDYAVESRVAPSAMADMMTISIRLVRTSGREIVWADRFSLSMGATPELYWDFANGISRALGDNIEAAELAKQRTERDADAYGHYLSGRHNLRSFDLPQVRRGRKSLRLARDIEPEEASIESALARTYVVEWVLRAGSDKALLDKARLHAERAVMIDPNDGTAYRELGRVALFDGDLDQSIEHMTRAADLSPHHADILADFADTLAHYSDFDAAEKQIEVAMKLNPLPPDDYYWTLGGISFFRGRWEDALRQLSQMQNTDPALRLMAATAAMAGQHDLARKYRLRALELQPDFTIARWMSKVPQRDPADLDLYIEALRRAGFQ